jgi:alpha-ketoglutarate-dependent taurine dioxygenase
MKITPISNFGNFGVYVDDIDMDHMTAEEWLELGRLFIKELVVVCRNIKITKSQYLDSIPKFGPLKANIRAYLTKKYSRSLDTTKPDSWGTIDSSDRRWLESRRWQLEESGDGRYLTRIYGRTDADGNMLGYFSNGEVHWHSNECSTLTFTPGVSLLGWEHMKGSATGFVQTVDLYESFSESFRSELDNMIIIHRYEKGRINENELTNEDLALHMKMGFCPVDDVQTPMVCIAPNGRRGLHYSMNTRCKIKDMSQEESNRIFEHLDKEIFNNNWVFDHHYEGDNDLLLFDNSVTLHRRLGGHADRKAFRMQWDVSDLIDSPWYPWQHSNEFNQEYIIQTNELIDILGGDLAVRFKRP